MRRVAVTIRGTVQGVGFRPFVYAHANARGLQGWVRNDADGVHLEVQGPATNVHAFLVALRSPPPAARINELSTVELPLGEESGFSILPSAQHRGVRPTLPADLALCPACAEEIDDPQARRHAYPFTNCTQCGPRYSIVEALPYDRASTSMKGFSLCATCEAEYHDPANRRFHAQPIACPKCGPRLSLLDANGTTLSAGPQALPDAAEALRQGRILALQGLGGFQLLVDATDEAAVRALRARKQREEKPFAVMFPSLDSVRTWCVVSQEEEDALTSAQAPIVLLERKAGARVADSIAPGNPQVGAMLPYTPLHRLLLDAVDQPVVCTSGNLSEEPMCVGQEEARQRLGRIAEAFLVHDRPIVRPVDDSIVRRDGQQMRVLRRARGWAPLAHALPCVGRQHLLSTGAQLKSTIAVAKDGQAVVSQHLGDLFSVEGALLLERTTRDLLRFLDVSPEVVACDLHPDYASTRLAEKLSLEGGIPVLLVQHHHAHVAACMAEHGLRGPVLGLAWDGAGLGVDGTLWGGEALVVDGASFRRVAHLRPFRLPGGEAAMREPWRSALGVLFELYGRELPHQLPLESPDAGVVLSMLEKGVASPATSSMGRLFDAVSALCGVRSRAGFEGQAAMQLEFCARGASESTAYFIPLGDSEPAVADWEPMIRALLKERRRGVDATLLSSRFHNALVELAEAIAQRVALPQVVLSGGCFQNARLLQTTRERLSAGGFQVFAPQQFPPHDGGLSLGQLYVAAHREEARYVPGHSG